VIYKAAFLGCGPRARQHAEAYPHVKKGRISAVCDMDEERLNSFGDDFGIEKRYTDVHEMLDKEKPDLLHVVTDPTLRVPLLTVAYEHEIPVVIVEKPIAVQGEDYRKICELEKKSATRIVVNHQLHFHPKNLEFKKVISDGRIGDIRFIDASAGSTPLDQGVHVLELIHSFSGFAAPIRVFGSVSGANALPSRQPSPDMCVAGIDFEDGVRAQLVCGATAPKTHENLGRFRLPVEAEAIYFHKRIVVYGTKGFVHWTMVDWEHYTPDGGYESGEQDYFVEDVKAQAVLIDAALDWREDEAKVHPTRLERALTQFNVILGLYTSALESAPVSLPLEPPGCLIDSLRSKLGN